MKKPEKKPENTQASVVRNPMEFLAVAAVVGTSNAIEGQEAFGQRSFVQSETLPVDGVGEEQKKVLEAAGCKFLGQVEDDSLFQFVQLPPGWRKEATEHSMWSRLLDDRGRERAVIFYKAAFYDRRASIHLKTRFRVRKNYDRKEVIEVSAFDGETAIHSLTSPIPESGDEYDSTLALEKQAETWLTERWPEWRSVGAYWEQP